MNPLTDTRVRNMVLAVLALLGIFLLVQSLAALSRLSDDNDMISSKVINVRGMGEVFGRPDVATFSFTVRENGKDATAVQQAMTTKANKAIDYLKSQGVEEKDIKTENYYSNPTYSYSGSLCTDFGCEPSKQVQTGYEVSETVSIKVRDLEKAGGFLTKVAELKIGEVSGLSFTIDNQDSLKAEAKKMAIEKARADAEKIAEALGVDLGDVVGFYEEYPYEGYGGDYYETSSSKSLDGFAPTLQAGETKVTASISVTYELED